MRHKNNGRLHRGRSVSTGLDKRKLRVGIWSSVLNRSTKRLIANSNSDVAMTADEFEAAFGGLELATA